MILAHRHIYTYDTSELRIGYKVDYNNNALNFIDYADLYGKIVGGSRTVNRTLGFDYESGMTLVTDYYVESRYDKTNSFILTVLEEQSISVTMREGLYPQTIIITRKQTKTTSLNMSQRFNPFPTISCETMTLKPPEVGPAQHTILVLSESLPQKAIWATNR